MSNFYCRVCEMPTYDPDSEECEACKDDNECCYCGMPIAAFEDACDACQESLDTDQYSELCDEDDEEFLRGPFR